VANVAISELAALGVLAPGVSWEQLTSLPILDAVNNPIKTAANEILLGPLFLLVGRGDFGSWPVMGPRPAQLPTSTPTHHISSHLTLDLPSHLSF
jgi:hypothetical protein